VISWGGQKNERQKNERQKSKNMKGRKVKGMMLGTSSFSSSVRIPWHFPFNLPSLIRGKPGIS
jgi:hypothetical protein